MPANNPCSVAVERHHSTFIFYIFELPYILPEYTVHSSHIMRVASTLAFSQWLIANSVVYPYSKLQVTRSSFYCKWLMVKGQLLGLDDYFPIPANSLSNGVLLQMISSGSGKPFPPELTEIMDSMYWWGKSISYEWYQECIEVLGEALWSDEDDQQVLVRTLISIEVRALIATYFHPDSMSNQLLWSSWLVWFNTTYLIAPKSFHGMANYSFEYVNWSIAQLNYHAAAPVVENLVEVISN
jgi:hypothetical protein